MNGRGVSASVNALHERVISIHPTRHFFPRRPGGSSEKAPDLIEAGLQATEAVLSDIEYTTGQHLTKAPHASCSAREEIRQSAQRVDDRMD